MLERILNAWQGIQPDATLRAALEAQTGRYSDEDTRQSEVRRAVVSI